MPNRNDALVKPIDKAILPPETNPLDESTQLQSSNQNSLATSDEAEELTTPEASLTYTELESDLDVPEITETADERPSQSTLNGATFHTTHRTTKMGDGDESQSWQIRETQRGTGHTEH